MKPIKPFILASASPRRRELLFSCGLIFEVCPAEINEDMLVGENPEEYVRRVAESKALAVKEKFPKSPILAADTVVVLDNTLFGKPRDQKEAFLMLRTLAGAGHLVITAFSLLCPMEQEPLTESVISEVIFRELGDLEIETYLKTGESMDKAGAYAVQGQGIFLIKEVAGSLTNVVGLPLKEVLAALEKHLGF
ncbi:MAG: Maf family protein [Deltaproteobacteria bacterium]|jgi:septum formation protein|nr:Maf family protein [Deltaproteobacteria bacterium]